MMIRLLAAHFVKRSIDRCNSQLDLCVKELDSAFIGEQAYPYLSRKVYQHWNAYATWVEKNKEIVELKHLLARIEGSTNE